MRYVLPLFVALLLASCGSSNGKSDYSGKWETGFGFVELVQKGDSLIGDFTGGNTGKFLGVIRNDTVYFTIKDASFTSEELEGYAEIRSNKVMKGQYRPKGMKVWEGKFWMMKK